MTSREERFHEEPVRQFHRLPVMFRRDLDVRLLSVSGNQAQEPVGVHLVPPFFPFAGHLKSPAGAGQRRFRFSRQMVDLAKMAYNERKPSESSSLFGAENGLFS